MIVEQLKYTIWAADAERAAAFYLQCFGGQIVRQNPHITEISIAGGLIAIHGGGEGKRTWTGLTFQVPDVVQGAGEIVAAGGRCEKEPQWEDDEPPHLAMCEDTEGNQIMLSRRRS
jgi:lactoylglutathione lyase